MEKSAGDVGIIKAVGDHIQRHIGDIAIVFHEKVSTDIHIDIFHSADTPKRPFHTLVTSGMSQKPMSVPRGAEDGILAELMLCLPASWAVNAQAFKDENNYRPVRLLKRLARYPHENKTWLYSGHSIISSDSPQPFAGNTKMTSAVLRYPFLVPDNALTIDVADGRRIRLWAVVPVYSEERVFIERNGFERFEELLRQHRVTELLDPNRVNVALMQ
jgi:Suppressor of fused protein (SUFU)